MAKYFIPSIAGTFAVIYLITLFSYERSHKAYLYNAYSPGYDEYFVIKSYQSLPLDTLVHFDDQAIVTDQATGYQARILSSYTSIH